MGRSDGLCRLRKENGLPCRNCVLYEKCLKSGCFDVVEEMVEQTPKKEKKEHKTLSALEKKLLEDLSIPAEQVQRMTGRTKGVIYHYRSRLKRK